MNVQVIISTSANQLESIEDASQVKITLGEVTYRIRQNQFGELVINKNCVGAGTSSIIIEPRVSNEIVLKN